MDKSIGQIAYEKDLLKVPIYHDGTDRPAWDETPEWQKNAWEQIAAKASEAKA